ncbi:hypothetical protein [Microbacterium hydrocarbonoxydans]|uniref:Uncharacterized protein n=1 Tax=Microbacterium hydrocarbonoxydans TaxID=273678 RepID=A0A1H4QM00_9MICO|nr:hypothetical protein [Microbacterium hydrocarbonoxydans]SEC20612.1 hypothetical protein SAMN04489807_3143 [Microbacterium hydrocarbonoxydans]
MDNALLFIIVIMVVLVIAVFLPRWIRRSSRSAGDRASQRYTERRRSEILDALSRTVVVHAPESVVREIVDTAVLQQPRRFSALSDGGYGIRFIESDDAVARLVGDPQGTRLQLDGFREYLGIPNTSASWAELRTRVSEAAVARGLTAHDGPAAAHRRDPETERWNIV